MKNDESKYIELDERRAMIYLPKNTVELTVVASVFCGGGELKKVQKTLNLDEVREAFTDAELNYIDDDDRFILTEKGERYLEGLERE
ncbi:MAG: hypothetical protein K6C34_00420 [Alphaproteobacteria bacterium]|nr:hypothetical protein [Alphaproteobacteria bacterium]